MSYGSNGYIVGQLPSPTQSTSVAVATADPNDLTQQDTLSISLQNAGLPPFQAVLSDVAGFLDSASGLSNDTSEFDADDSLVARQSRSMPETKHLLAKRGFWSDFLEGFKLALCNEIVTSLLEAAEGICGGVEAAEAVYCLATGCYKGSPKAPPVEYAIDTSGRFTVPGFRAPGIVKETATGFVRCTDCSLTVSRWMVKGSVVIDMQSMSVIDAAWDVAQDMVANLDINVSATGAESSSWTYAMSTLNLKSAEISGILKISPQATYGIGASWSTTSAISMSMAKTLTLAGTNLRVYPFSSGKDIYNSWQPTFNTREPMFSTNASASLSGSMQSSIDVDVYVFGTKLSALTLSTSTNFGFSGGLVTVAKQARAPCPGGTYQIVQYNRGDQYIYTGSSGRVTLYSQGGNGSPQCVNLPLSAPSDSQVKDLAKVKNGGAFCSSLISYKAPTTTATSTTTIFVATSTATVLGGGTTTITPSPTTTSITTTLSVVTSPSKIPARKAKRTAHQSAPSRATAPSASSTPSIPHDVLQVREVIRTPILVATWVPQQVSSACSRIATGTMTASTTVPATILSGVTTLTVQATVTAAIPIVTATSSYYVPAAAAPTEAILAPTFPTPNW